MPVDSSSSLSRAVARFGVVPAILMPVWFAGGRLLTDSAGTLSIILAVSAAPLLLVLHLSALWLPTRRRRRISPRAAAFLVASWVFGVSFGFTVPDLGEGASSVLVALAGEEVAGLSAAVSNPSGILMTFTAVLALGFSVVDSRRIAGATADEVVDEETMLRLYGYSFQDEQPSSLPESAEGPSAMAVRRRTHDS